MRYLIAIFSLALIFSCSKKGRNNEKACNGNTRRPVKICIDDASSEIDTNVIDISIADFGAIEVPEVDKETPRQDVEKQVYRITGVIDKIKRYRDGDYHIRLIDENENYVITEAANPDCEHAFSSLFIEEIRAIENLIESSDFEEGDTVTITGVSFVDLDHHYKRKQAENNMELHPILLIE